MSMMLDRVVDSVGTSGVLSDEVLDAQWLRAKIGEAVGPLGA